MLEVQEAPVTSPDTSAKAGRFFVRFTRAQRTMHAVLFSTFLGLAATGLPLRFSQSIWARRLATEVGGFGAILFFHKLCAIVLTIAFAIHVKDIFAHFRWFLGLGPRPVFERYAYWEKFDYWAVFWGMMVIGFSGYAMWFAPFFAHFLPGWALNAVLVIHSEEGLLAILFIFSIHFVNTHLRPGSFPMDMVIFTGVESEEEFKTKRAVEYERLAKQGKLEGRLGVKPATWLVNFSRGVGAIAIAIGLILLVLTLTAYFGE